MKDMDHFIIIVMWTIARKMQENMNSFNSNDNELMHYL